MPDPVVIEEDGTEREVHPESPEARQVEETPAPEEQAAEWEAPTQEVWETQQQRLTAMEAHNTGMGVELSRLREHGRAERTRFDQLSEQIDRVNRFVDNQETAAEAAARAAEIPDPEQDPRGFFTQSAAAAVRDLPEIRELSTLRSEIGQVREILTGAQNDASERERMQAWNQYFYQQDQQATTDQKACIRYSDMVGADHYTKQGMAPQAAIGRAVQDRLEIYSRAHANGMTGPAALQMELQRQGIRPEQFMPDPSQTAPETAEESHTAATPPAQAPVRHRRGLTLAQQQNPPVAVNTRRPSNVAGNWADQIVAGNLEGEALQKAVMRAAAKEHMQIREAFDEVRAASERRRKTA